MLVRDLVMGIFVYAFKGIFIRNIDIFKRLFL